MIRPTRKVGRSSSEAEKLLRYPHRPSGWAEKVLKGLPNSSETATTIQSSTSNTGGYMVTVYSAVFPDVPIYPGTYTYPYYPSTTITTTETNEDKETIKELEEDIDKLIAEVNSQKELIKILAETLKHLLQEKAKQSNQGCKCK